MTVVANELSSMEVVRRVEAGEAVLCPACRTRLEPIPAQWQPGMRLSGVACPRSQQHYLTLLDDAETVSAIRARFRKARESRPETASRDNGGAEPARKTG